MKILAFDTSTRYMSIACLKGGELVSEFHEDVGIRHSEILVPTIKRMLDALEWKPSDLELLCVGLGPGSFTGLRIAVATIKGAMLTLDAKAVGVPSMDAMAFNAPREKKIVSPLLDAHKGKVYSCIYDLSGGLPKRKTEYLLISPEDLVGGLKEDVFFFGNGVTKYKKSLDSSKFAHYDEGLDWYPRAARIGLLGLERSKSGADDPESIEPMYLHAKECDISDEVLRKIREKKESKK